VSPTKRSAAREVPCPTCGKAAVFSPDNPWRPFCSERCKTVDLGAWAEERYRIPAPPEEDDSEPSGSTGPG
jgi:endogenous inhibitor of DNA gyrase (YacG/DUF329 family)